MRASIEDFATKEVHTSDWNETEDEDWSSKSDSGGEEMFLEAWEDEKRLEDRYTPT